MKKMVFGFILISSMSAHAEIFTLKQSSLLFVDPEKRITVTCGEQGEFAIGSEDPCNMSGELPVCGTTRFAYLEKGEFTMVYPAEAVFVKCK